jgi:hypothetical protein
VPMMPTGAGTISRSCPGWFDSGGLHIGLPTKPEQPA